MPLDLLDLEVILEVACAAGVNLQVRDMKAPSKRTKGVKPGCAGPVREALPGG